MKLKSKSAAMIRHWIIKLKTTIKPRLLYTFYEKDNKKYLGLIIMKSGRTYWSKHFIIEAVDNEQGVKNDHYDKRVDEFFNTSSR
nr:MAG TPA: hypothetical protein [Caudoviricetes sp.]